MGQTNWTGCWTLELTSECDFGSDIDQNKERQKVHLAQSHDLAIFIVFVVGGRCMDLRLSGFNKAFCGDGRYDGV